ncbi:Hypp2267 [Branchiostoma lanceolatum]|uniref:Hypp2267 protein n=1 Tax=Branchiostoma lanceolatum TaxID=7740 RepID=A0A8J9ZPT3_BRALA|nr:Hypp2267 [Branchiostoma lanceolatum]
MADMDRSLEVEVLKTLGDVNLEKGQLDKIPEKFDRAMMLYRTALLRCKDAEVAEKLRHLDKNLTEGFNNDTLVEYIKFMIEGIVDKNNILEVEAIKSLGDVHLKRGTETRDTTCFTKATALYNTALARCEGFQGTVALVQRLLCTAKVREETENIRKKGLRRSKQQQNHLTLGSSVTFGNTGALTDVTCHQFLSPNEYIASSTNIRATPDYRTYHDWLTKGDRALKDGKLNQAERDFASALKLIHDPNKPDRCKEAQCLSRLGDVYVQQGKRTRQELVTPYSDLEFAILIEDGKDNDDTRRYFLNLTHYLHLKVINLGETILPAMAIPSLNDFQSEDPEKTWFFDSITPRGFAFDGFMPWACKTPFGRSKTTTKPHFSLIQTPAKMAEFQQLDVSLSEGDHLPDILRRA